MYSEGSHPARFACAVCRDQPRRAVGDNQASFRGVFEPILEASERLAAGTAADDVRRRRTAARLEPRHHESGCAAEPWNRRPASCRIHRRMEGVGSEDPPLPSAGGRPRRRNTLSRDSAAAGWRAAGRFTPKGCRAATHEASWCASVRVAQPERAQRQLYLCGDAERVRRASTLDRKSPRNKVVKAATRARRHEEYNSISSSCFPVFVAKFVL